MYTKLCVLLLAIGLSQAVPQLVMPDLGLMQFMMQARDLSQGNPSRSLECFDYYIPILNGYAETYKKEFAQCLDVAAQARQDIDDTTAGERAEINSSAGAACDALNACSQINTAVEFFQCYSNQGANNSKVLYSISANSSELLAQVNQEYYLINISEEACTNKSERAYVENNNNCIDDLNKCIIGELPIPSESSSAAPESSTAAPTPAPTSAPTESSSQAPSEPSSSSQAPTEASTESSSEASSESSSESSPESSSESSPESSSESSPEPSSEATTQLPREQLPEEDLSRMTKEQAKLQEVLQSMKNWFHRQ